MHQSLQQDKFENANLKHGNNIFKFQHKSLLDKLGIFGPNIKDFYFVPNFAVRRIWEHWFQICQCLFCILAWKYPNKAFFILNVSIFKFCTKLRIWKSLMVLIRKMAIVFFPNPSQKYPNTNICWKTQIFFLFEWNIEWT